MLSPLQIALIQRSVSVSGSAMADNGSGLITRTTPNTRCAMYLSINGGLIRAFMFDHPTMAICWSLHRCRQCRNNRPCYWRAMCTRCALGIDVHFPNGDFGVIEWILRDLAGFWIQVLDHVGFGGVEPNSALLCRWRCVGSLSGTRQDIFLEGFSLRSKRPILPADIPPNQTMPS